ncbi:MAG TPA: dihydroorotate dehydrogenase catalytic subunit, partial [Solirubrobacteraceae bacterium]|nr:dihydroorotate dehydrogenase catalytic subunit [Solirubrobacteraceae bacterium]
MSLDFCGIELAHPVINGSGTFDALAANRVFGDALHAHFPFAAFVSKTITLQPRAGNPPPRLWEAQAGMINSIGLPNKGLERYLVEDLPELARLPVPLITNVMGGAAEELAELAAACEDRAEIAAIELNVSCPNVKTGLDIGADPRQLAAVIERVRPATGKPLIVKLTPNCADVAACALAAEGAGANAVSLINTLRAYAPAPARAPEEPSSGPWLGGGSGGLSGPAIRPVALAQVSAVAARVSI